MSNGGRLDANKFFIGKSPEEVRQGRTMFKNASQRQLVGRKTGERSKSVTEEYEEAKRFFADIERSKLTRPERGTSRLGFIKASISEWANVIAEAAKDLLIAPWARITGDLKRKSDALQKVLNDIDKPSAGDAQELALVAAYSEYHRAISRAGFHSILEAKKGLPWVASRTLGVGTALATLEKACDSVQKAYEIATKLQRYYTQEHEKILGECNRENDKLNKNSAMSDNQKRAMIEKTHGYVLKAAAERVEKTNSDSEALLSKLQELEEYRKKMREIFEMLKREQESLDKETNN